VYYTSQIHVVSDIQIEQRCLNDILRAAQKQKRFRRRNTPGSFKRIGSVWDSGLRVGEEVAMKGYNRQDDDYAVGVVRYAAAFERRSRGCVAMNAQEEDLGVRKLRPPNQGSRVRWVYRSRGR